MPFAIRRRQGDTSRELFAPASQGEIYRRPTIPGNRGWRWHTRLVDRTELRTSTKKPDVILVDSTAQFSNGEETTGSSNAAGPYFAGVVAAMKAAQPKLQTRHLLTLARRGEQANNSSPASRREPLPPTAGVAPSRAQEQGKPARPQITPAQRSDKPAAAATNPVASGASAAGNRGPAAQLGRTRACGKGKTWTLPLVSSRTSLASRFAWRRRSGQRAEHYFQVQKHAGTPLEEQIRRADRQLRD